MPLNISGTSSAVAVSAPHLSPLSLSKDLEQEFLGSMKFLTEIEEGYERYNQSWERIEVEFKKCLMRYTQSLARDIRSLIRDRQSLASKEQSLIAEDRIGCEEACKFLIRYERIQVNNERSLTEIRIKLEKCSLNLKQSYASLELAKLEQFRRSFLQGGRQSLIWQRIYQDRISQLEADIKRQIARQSSLIEEMSKIKCAIEEAKSLEKIHLSCKKKEVEDRRTSFEYEIQDLKSRIEIYTLRIRKKFVVIKSNKRGEEILDEMAKIREKCRNVFAAARRLSYEDLSHLSQCIAYIHLFMNKHSELNRQLAPFFIYATRRKNGINFSYSSAFKTSMKAL